MTENSKNEGGRQRDDLLRRALATPPISNEEIVRRSKALHKRVGRKAGRKPG